jgi:hypothetical protein
MLRRLFANSGREIGADGTAPMVRSVAGPPVRHVFCAKRGKIGSVSVMSIDPSLDRQLGARRDERVDLLSGERASGKSNKRRAGARARLD